MVSEEFIIDADTLITPYKIFYPFDMFPDFWDFIGQKMKSEEIKTLDLVYNEIARGNDSLRDWLLSIKGIKKIERKNNVIISNYGNILNYISTCGFYKIEALNSWSTATTADPWLIATALNHSYTVITFEKPNQSLNSKQKTKDVKIPDICNEFNVKCENLYYMMRQLGFKRT